MTTIATTTIKPNADAAKTGALRELRTAVNEVVGSVFFAPLLRCMRNSPLKGTYGHGGRGEEVFQAQLDQILAERAGQAANNSLNRTIFDRLSRAAAAHGKASENDDVLQR
jgi:hypothetical protein